MLSFNDNLLDGFLSVICFSAYSEDGASAHVECERVPLHVAEGSFERR